jgi:hypothetical protein
VLHRFGQDKLANGGSIVPIFATAPATLKMKSVLKVVKNRLENNHLSNKDLNL